MRSLGCRTSNPQLLDSQRLELDTGVCHSCVPTIVRDTSRKGAAVGSPSLCLFFIPPQSLFEPGMVAYVHLQSQHVGVRGGKNVSS